MTVTVDDLQRLADEQAMQDLWHVSEIRRRSRKRTRDTLAVLIVAANVGLILWWVYG